MKRQMNAFEEALTHTNDLSPLNAVIALSLRGDLPPAILRQVLDWLQRRYTPLGWHITNAQGRHFLESDNTRQIPLEVIDWAGDDEWQSAVESELNTRIEYAPGPLVRCIYLHQAGAVRQDLVLCFNHTIVDAPSATHLLDELLAACADCLSGRPLAEPEALQPPPPADEVFPPSFKGSGLTLHMAAFMARQMRDEAVYRIRLGGRRQPPVSEPAHTRILTAGLPQETTDRLIGCARRERVAMNSVLHAALLFAVQKCLYAEETIPLQAVGWADLRPYLKPPVGAENLGCYITMSRFTALIGPRRDFWEVAREIDRVIYRAARRGEKFTAFMMSKPLMEMLVRLKSLRMGATALTYTGVAQLQKHYGPLDVLGLHAFVSNVPIGPQYAASARIFDDALCLDLIYLDTDMDRTTARRIADEVTAGLAAACQQ